MAAYAKRFVGRTCDAKQAVGCQLKYCRQRQFDGRRYRGLMVMDFPAARAEKKLRSVSSPQKRSRPHAEWLLWKSSYFRTVQSAWSLRESFSSCDNEHNRRNLDEDRHPEPDPWAEAGYRFLRRRAQMGVSLRATKRCVQRGFAGFEAAASRQWVAKMAPELGQPFERACGSTRRRANFRATRRTRQRKARKTKKDSTTGAEPRQLEVTHILHRRSIEKVRLLRANTALAATI